jgi:hypothetical protein
LPPPTPGFRHREFIQKALPSQKIEDAAGNIVSDNYADSNVAFSDVTGLLINDMLQNCGETRLGLLCKDFKYAVAGKKQAVQITGATAGS